jgi:O-antigen/teichoic acid export membrane protein
MEDRNLLRALRNTSSNWLGLAVSIAVGFFLSPIILHKLGDEAYGLWLLIFSITGYYGLFDLGIRSSIIKHVAKYAATSNYNQLTRLINTSLFSYGCLAVTLLLLTQLGSWYVGSIFHIAPEFLDKAKLLFLIAGTALALGFPLGVFSGVLEGLQQFQWLNLIQIATNLLRALLIVVALKLGQGLISVALITVTLPLVASGAYIASVRRLIPLSFGRQYVNRASLRELISYGAITFVAIVAQTFRLRSDAILIGIFLPVSAITYFSIGSKLVDYAHNVVDAMGETLLPLSSHFDATSDNRALCKLFISGNRACAMIAFPICAVMVILGKSIIEAWVGATYLPSYVILVVLVVPRTVLLAQAASTRILYGMARHRPLALALLVEGVANLMLSLLLIRRFGIIGDAIGTAIPLLCTSLFFLPYYLSQLLGISLRTFLKQAYVFPLKLCVPLVASLVAMHYWFYAHDYIQLLAELFVAGTIYGASLFWFIARQPARLGARANLIAYVQEALTR